MQDQHAQDSMDEQEPGIFPARGIAADWCRVNVTYLRAAVHSHMASVISHFTNMECCCSSIACNNIQARESAWSAGESCKAWLA